jgi:PAS domain S-box-containing protein
MGEPPAFRYDRAMKFSAWRHPASLGPIAFARWQACAIAALATVATLGVRLALQPQLGAEPALVIFMVPIMLGAYLGGLPAGIVATVLSFLLASYFLLEPLHTFRVAAAEQRWNVCLLLAAGLVISFLNEAARRARSRNDQAVIERNAEKALRESEAGERQMAQDAVRQAELRLRSVIDSMFVFVGLMTPDGAVVEINRAPLIAAGLERERVLGNPLSETYWFSDSAATQAQVRLALTQAAQGEIVRGDYEMRLAENKMITIDATFGPLRDASGRIVQIVGSAVDITDRRRSESLLLATYKEIGDLKTAQDEHSIVAITDAQGIITYVNDKFCALSQYSRDELLGCDHRMINTGTYPQEFSQGIWDTIATGRVWKGEIRSQAKDGSLYWVETTIVPNLGPDGRPHQYISIRTDITGRKRSEEALSQINCELESARLVAEKASSAKSEFLSSMSHELRTPLNGIIGFAEFLMDEKPGPLRPKQKEYLGDVLNSGRHLLQLINDVLDLSKIEAGKMELHPEVFAVRKAAAEVAAVVQGIAQKKHIAVEINIGEGLDAVVLDQHKFKQMLYNLLSNAVKFSDDDGRVELRARRLDSEWFEVSVRDAGIGIKADDLIRLFGKFEQLDAGAARRFEGTGLGLALTRNIVEFQGGRMTVESELGKGSVFTVVLPTLTKNRRAE